MDEVLRLAEGSGAKSWDHLRTKGRDSQGNAVNGVVEAASELAAAEATDAPWRDAHRAEGGQSQRRPASTGRCCWRERQAGGAGGVQSPGCPNPGGHPHTACHRRAGGERPASPSSGRSRTLGRISRQRAAAVELDAGSPKVFSSLFVAIIHVGENTGQLEEAFLQLANYFDLELETRKRIKTAMRYPAS